MIDPPTDRLHKLMAIGGIALIIAGVTIPLERFNDAELHRIEAADKAREFAYAYSDFAKKVNEGIDAHNRWVKEPTDENAERLRKIVLSNEEAVQNLDRTTRDAMLKFQKQIELASHYGLIQNIWVAIGVLCIGGGFALSFLGFRRWLLEPKRSR